MSRLCVVRGAGARPLTPFAKTWCRRDVKAAWLLVLLVPVCASACTAGPPAPQVTPKVAVEADRPTPEGPTVRRCGSHYANDFDAGLDHRLVQVGRVSLVTFRAAPTGADGPVHAFKVMVRLEAGADASVETMTMGTSLLYDRGRFQTSGLDRLTEGDQSVRFVGCPDEPAVFNGAVLTTGPRSLALTIVEGGQRRTARVTAYE